MVKSFHVDVANIHPILNLPVDRLGLGRNPADGVMQAGKMLIVQKAGICKHLYINIPGRISLV